MLSQSYVGIYHQYDTVVYPRALRASKALIQAGRDYLASFLRNKKQDHADPMLKECLNLYLGPCKSQLLQVGEYSGEFKVDLVTEQVYHVYKMHRAICIKCKGTQQYISAESVQHVSY